MKTLVTGRLGPQMAELLTRACAGLEVRVATTPTADDVGWAEVLTGFAWPAGVTGGGVRWIHAMGLGLDGFATAPAPELCTRTVGTMPLQMGHYVLGAVVATFQRHAELADAQARQTWEPLPALAWPSRALVLGTGLAAQGVARALASVGVPSTGVNRSGRPVPGFDRVVRSDALVDSFTGAPPSLVVDLLPLTPATVDVVGAALFSMLDGALLVNVGRGATIDEAALRDALATGRVARAWLDVHREEPLPPAHWAWGHSRVHVTPHVAALTTPEDAAFDFLSALAAQRVGRTPPTLVDLDAYAGSR